MPRRDLRTLRLRAVAPIRGVMSTVTPATEIAWLFIRADESVRIEMTRSASGYRLDVWGPGRARAGHEFDDAPAAISAAEMHQRSLVDQGFSLQARAERRASGDRRRNTRGADNERRQR
jgi:hypothetical protein